MRILYRLYTLLTICCFAVMATAAAVKFTGPEQEGVVAFCVLFGTFGLLVTIADIIESDD